MRMVSAYIRVLYNGASVLTPFSHEWFRRLAGYVMWRPCPASGYLNADLSSMDVKLGDSATYRPICLSGDFQRSQESIPVLRLVVSVDNH